MLEIWSEREESPVRRASLRQAGRIYGDPRVELKKKFPLLFGHYLLSLQGPIRFMSNERTINLCFTDNASVVPTSLLSCSITGCFFNYMSKAIKLKMKFCVPVFLS